MTRLALAVVLTATAGVAAVVTHHTRRPVQAQTMPAPVHTLARASRGDTRTPLRAVPGGLVVAARRHTRETSPTRRGALLDWPALARCESGGNPRTNTGNGYYGAYQFDAETWASVGGHGLPSDNSLAEQTYRARLLYAQRGRSPWPSCGRHLRVVVGR